MTSLWEKGAIEARRACQALYASTFNSSLNHVLPSIPPSCLLPLACAGLLLPPTGLPVSAQPEEMTVQKGRYLGFSGGIGWPTGDGGDPSATGEITVGYQLPDDAWWVNRFEGNFSYTLLRSDCPPGASCSGNKFNIGISSYRHFTLPNAPRWVPYFGSGFGYAKITSGYTQTLFGSKIKADSEAGGIYIEPKLGISYSLNESFDAFFQSSYQWIFSGDPTVKVTLDNVPLPEFIAPGGSDSNFINFMLGMRYRF